MKPGECGRRQHDCSVPVKRQCLLILLMSFPQKKTECSVYITEPEISQHFTMRYSEILHYVYVILNVCLLSPRVAPRGVVETRHCSYPRTAHGMPASFDLPAHSRSLGSSRKTRTLSDVYHFIPAITPEDLVLRLHSFMIL